MAFTPQEISQILEEFFNVVGTRQYIGPRLVPIFGRKDESSIDWDGGLAPYEPLTVVLYQGNSYTSRQYVPTGVQITNDAYWAQTGNYNAQVEQYRQTVLLFDGRITDNADAITSLDTSVAGLQEILPASDFTAESTVKEYVDDSIAEASELAYVGHYGAQENTANQDWASIFAAIAEVSKTISFGSGQWLIDETLVIPNNIQNICGTGAQITANSSIGTMMRLTSTHSSNTRFVRIDGLTFDGADLADKCLQPYTGGGNELNVFNCSFKNFNTIAIDNSSAIGLFVSNCLFANQLEKNKGIGIATRTDSIIANCKFFYLKTAIATNQAHISNCYFFTQSMTEPSYGVVGLSFGLDNTDIGSSLNVTVDNCEFDCITRCFASIAQLVVERCNFYWNGVDDTLSGYNRVIFYQALRQRFSDIEFNYNNIGMSGDNPIIGYVKSFESARATGSLINRYHSIGNKIRGFYDANTPDNTIISKYRICMGLDIQNQTEGTNASHYHSTLFDFESYESSVVSPNIAFTSLINFATFKCHGFHINNSSYTNLVSVAPVSPSYVNFGKLLFNYDISGNVSQMLFTEHPYSLKEIYVGNSPVFNFRLLDNGEYNESNWTDVITSKIVAATAV